MEIKSIEIKAPTLEYEVHPLIQKRWSPRSFSNRSIEQEKVNEIFEAASWAASSSNEQPWKYVYAHKGTKGFDQLWNCLMPGNQPWAKNAALIFAALYRTTFESSGKPNHAAPHDLGMANANLILQAAHRDIYGHFMGGYYPDKLLELLQPGDQVKPLCMGVLGYLGHPEDLDEPFRSRELTERNRKPLSSFLTKLG